MENSENSNTVNAIVSPREKLDQVATWVSATVSSAFFSSLERFSCVNLTTTDPDDDDDDEEANDRPLTLTDHHPKNDSVKLQP